MTSPVPVAAPARPATPAERLRTLALAQSLAPLDALAFSPVLDRLQVQSLAAGDSLLQAGQPADLEYFVLDGVLKTWVGDAQGREVTLAFHAGPGVVSPAITRVANGCSRVHLQALTPACVAGFPAQALVACMLAQPQVQCWGDAVLRAELVRRADREWSLAALPAAQRLQQFRAQFGALPGRIAQHHIASYLGITPVSLSRLQAQERARQAQDS